MLCLYILPYCQLGKSKLSTFICNIRCSHKVNPYWKSFCYHTFTFFKICFRYRNSNVSSKSPGVGGRGLGRYELNYFADNSFVNQNVNKFSVFFVNQMVYYIFAQVSPKTDNSILYFFSFTVCSQPLIIDNFHQKTSI